MAWKAAERSAYEYFKIYTKVNAGSGTLRKTQVLVWEEKVYGEENLKMNFIQHYDMTDHIHSAWPMLDRILMDPSFS